MKLKRFENWVSDTTDKSINVNYGVNGDKGPEISRFVTLIENYIEDHFENISNINMEHLVIEFTSGSLIDDKYQWPDYEKICVYRSRNGNYYRYFINTIKKDGNNRIYRDIDISEDEYKHISNFIFNIEKKYKKRNQKKDLDDILSDIDPVLKNAKNYNL